MKVRAHPRSRGEHSIDFVRRGSNFGSSPLTRGARSGIWQKPRRRWLIPAHAGSTPMNRGGVSYATAHPRSRGEHPALQGTYAASSGSSPLTRGAPCWSARLAKRWGLIPAHAGSTNWPSCLGKLSGAHPRSRGEHTASLVCVEAGDGSSPLTRGAPGIDPRRGLNSGLIPAHAGSTRTSWCGPTSRSAHPRSRGEHLVPQYAQRPPNGSSPLTRGALSKKIFGFTLWGLIPAHAGSTQSANYYPNQT